MDVASAMADISDFTGFGTEAGSDFIKAFNGYLNAGFTGDGFMFNSDFAEKYLAGKYASDTFYGAYAPDFAPQDSNTNITISLYLDDEKIVDEAVRPNPFQNFSYNINGNTVNNGKR